MSQRTVRACRASTVPGVLLLVMAPLGCGVQRAATSIRLEAPPDQWRTYAEQTNYRETGRYEETVDFCRRLAAASPYAHYTSFGVTGEGRELPLLIVSRDRAFTPDAARRSGKALVLVQNCIHSGECEGKDASLALARDILITGTQANLLDHVNLLILPIFNADGHERRSPFGRINQNGPNEMGWRTNAVNLNLNRDYAKADSVEMQAWLRLWNAWQPDLFIDDHTTDGHEHQYDWFYAATMDQDVAQPVGAWVRETLLPGILPVLDQASHASLPYSFPRDPKDLSKGVVALEPMPPRFSTGYGGVCNRPSLLVETQAPRPYGRRVQVTYEVLLNTLTTVNRTPQASFARPCSGPIKSARASTARNTMAACRCASSRATRSTTSPIAPSNRRCMRAKSPAARSSNTPRRPTTSTP